MNGGLDDIREQEHGTTASGLCLGHFQVKLWYLLDTDTQDEIQTETSWQIS